MRAALSRMRVGDTQLPRSVELYRVALLVVACVRHELSTSCMLPQG